MGGLLAVIFCGSLYGCGRTGPLYLPPKKITRLQVLPAEVHEVGSAAKQRKGQKRLQ